MAIRSPEWKFELTVAADQSRIAELVHATNRSITLSLNAAGQCQFNLSLEDEWAPFIWPLVSGIQAWRRNSAGQWKLIWSGFVWMVEENLSAGSATMTVTAVGWLQRLEKRILRRDKVYTAAMAMTDGDIIHDLLTEMNLTTLAFAGGYTIPIPDGAANPATPTLMTPGSLIGDFSTHLREVAYLRGVGCLAQMRSLVDLENGCDLLVDPATRELDVWARKGADLTSSVVFGYNAGPENLKSFSRQLDPTTLANFMYVTADATLAPQYADTKLNPNPTNPLLPAIGENSMPSYGIIEENVVLTDARTTSVMLTYAGEEVLLRSSPHLVFSFAPMPYTEYTGEGRVPEPFEDYNLGDIVRLDAKWHGRFQIEKMGVRVFGLTIAPDDNTGTENITDFQLAP